MRNVPLMRLSGLVSHRMRRTFMVNGSGVSRGDRNRNARLVRLRELVPLENAVVGIDLADRKQMVVVTDHDSRVLARRTFRCRAWDLGTALDWAAERAALAGFAGGLSALGAASILAETGDLNRFATARALVKHAG